MDLEKPDSRRKYRITDILLPRVPIDERKRAEAGLLPCMLFGIDVRKGSRNNLIITIEYEDNHDLAKVYHKGGRLYYFARVSPSFEDLRTRGLAQTRQALS